MITEEIKAIIEKDLPAQVGKSLQKVLAEGEKAKEDVVKWKNVLIDVKKHNEALEKENDKLKDLKHTSEALDTREKKLDAKEQKQEVEILKVQLTESEKRADMVKDFTSGLVRNTTFRKEMFGYRDVPGVIDNNGYQQPPQNLNNNNTETTTEE